MVQIFRPRANTIAVLVLASLAVLPVLLVGFGYALMRSPYTTEQYLAREQPIPFSHQHHAGVLGIDCRYCHTSVESARFAGLPATETCMTCHSQVWTNAAMLAPVRTSLAARRPLRWRRVHTLPGYVYFDHSIHIAKGVGCSTCHGRVDQMPLVRQVAPLTMAWCLDCHRHPQDNLRPRSAVFDMTWTPESQQPEEGRRLLREYHVQTAAKLTDCSICHR
jgi:hypothetical protein